MIQIIDSSTIQTVFHPDKEYLLIPFFVDFNQHYLRNSVMSVGVLCLTDGQRYFIPIQNRDVTSPIRLADIPFAQSKCLWTPKANALRPFIDTPLNDLQIVEFNANETVTDASKFYSSIARKDLYAFNYSGLFVPIYQLCDACEEAFNFWEPFTKIPLPNHYQFENDIVMPTLARIEKSGLKVDRNIFMEKFSRPTKLITDRDFVFTEYNPHTITGRITNRYGGINYSALPKHDGSRAAFISRYSNGKLVQFDYKEYHIRLIGHWLGQFDYEGTLPLENIHEYFAKQYFGEEYTTEMYDMAKQKTFKYLYSGDDSSGIEFFRIVKEQLGIFWEYFEKREAFNSLLAKRIIWKKSINNPNPSKVFNYLIQSLEMEHSIQRLYNVFRMPLDGAEPILYTYDSILFDMPLHSDQIIKEIAETLSYGIPEMPTLSMFRRKGLTDMKYWKNMFPVSISEGSNYQDLKKIS